MTESKKAWLEPELIVLVRSKPEEAVLTVCKNSLVSAGPYYSWGICYNSGCFGQCFDRIGS